MTGEQRALPETAFSNEDVAWGPRIERILSLKESQEGTDGCRKSSTRPCRKAFSCHGAGPLDGRRAPNGAPRRSVDADVRKYEKSTAIRSAESPEKIWPPFRHRSLKRRPKSTEP